jgi:hypothetical protein
VAENAAQRQGELNSTNEIGRAVLPLKAVRRTVYQISDRETGTVLIACTSYPERVMPSAPKSYQNPCRAMAEKTHPLQPNVAFLDVKVTKLSQSTWNLRPNNEAETLLPGNLLKPKSHAGGA